MKLIGKLETGERLVGISAEEMIELAAAAQALSNITLDFRLTNLSVITAPTRERPAPERVRPSKADKKVESRLCEWCNKPLPKNASPTAKTHKGECTTLFRRKYARDLYHAKHGKKPDEVILPPGNPANPSLTDQQRQELKAKREEMLKTINQRLDAHGN